MEIKNDCYNCKHRRTIIGDAHSKCAYGWVKGDFRGKNRKIKIIVNQWSIMFPNNFDPNWVKKCDNHELK